MRLSDAEWIVMNALWENFPAPAREVLGRVEDETGWAYSTLKTLLARLVEKGALDTHKRANTSLYEPLITREQARRSALHRLLDKAFDGTFGSLLQHMVAAERLSPRERRRLAELLTEQAARREARP